MRIGTRVGRRSWVSMGPLGWLLLAWLALPLLLVWWTVLALVWLVRLVIMLCRHQPRPRPVRPRPPARPARPAGDVRQQLAGWLRGQADRLDQR
jgi:hypothetical protein